MNWKKKMGGFAFLSVMTLSLLTGCVYEEQMEPTTNVPTLHAMTGNEITFEHKVGNSIIKTHYDLGDYLLEDWKITDSKSIRMNIQVKKLNKGTEILVDHLHADVSIKSLSAQLNGVTQDSMDNNYHGTSQDGFFINEKNAYTNIFAIEGFSKDIISGWNFYMGSYGTGETLTSSKLTETNLLERGTYGSQLTVVYNLLIKNPGDEKYHLESIEDKVIIPTALTVKRSNEINNQAEEE